MTYDPYKVIPAVLLAVYRNNKILLTRRRNTSYMDGWYSLPGGHMEENETLQECGERELKEETGLRVLQEDLELYLIYQNQNTPGRQYLGFIFRTDKWQGGHGIHEDKSDDVDFFALNDLPEKLIPYHLEAIKRVKNQNHIEIIYTPLGSFDPAGK